MCMSLQYVNETLNQLFGNVVETAGDFIRLLYWVGYDSQLYGYCAAFEG